MIAIFKKVQILYIIAGFSGLAVVCAVTTPFDYGVNTIGFWVFLLTIVFWLFFCAHIASFFAAKELNKIIELVTNECAPRRCIDALVPLLANAKREDVRRYILLQIATRYFDCGEFEKCREHLSFFPAYQPANSGMKALNNALQYCTLVAYSFATHNMPQAEHGLQCLQQELQNKYLGKNIKTHIENLYTQRRLRLQIAKGQYDEAMQVFQRIFDVGSLYERVTADYILADILSATGKPDEARQALQYVIEHGNELHLVQEAQRKLAERQRAE